MQQCREGKRHETMKQGEIHIGQILHGHYTLMHACLCHCHIQCQSGSQNTVNSLTFDDSLGRGHLGLGGSSGALGRRRVGGRVGRHGARWCQPLLKLSFNGSASYIRVGGSSPSTARQTLKTNKVIQGSTINIIMPSSISQSLHYP